MYISQMDLSRLRSELAKDENGNSTNLRNGVRRLGTFLHHYYPATAGRVKDSGIEFNDPIARSGLDAPSSSIQPGRTPLWELMETRGFPNPVLTASDVTDYGRVDYVADPFLLLDDNRWYLYFEIFNPDRDPTAVIGRAVSHNAGKNWEYDGIVLDPGVHISFPYVFRFRGSVWMVPNLDPVGEVAPVILYESTDDGKTFQKRATLVRPESIATDRVVFYWQQRWWLFVSVAGEERELRVYYSDSLVTSGWNPHQNNPVAVDKPRIPGGRPIVTADRIVMFFQNGPDYYGEVVESYEISELSPSVYVDTKLDNEAVLSPSNSLFGWNTGRMHTLDPWFTGDRWVCAVDGDIGWGHWLFTPHWSIGLYSLPIRDSLYEPSRDDGPD